MENINVSDIVLSINGRESGRPFVVIAVEGEYLLLADGRGRRVEKPKRKKAKHTQFIGSSGMTRVTEKLWSGEKVTNAELRRTLADSTLLSSELASSDLSCGSNTEGGMPVG